MVVYIDILFALNLLIDFLLLSVTAHLTHRPHRRFRLVLSAAAGAALACAVFLWDAPGLWWLFIDTLTAAGLVRIAFAWDSARAFIRSLVVLLLCSAVFGGVCTAIWTWVAPDGFMVVGGVVYYNIPALLLVGLTVAAYALLWIFDRVQRRHAGAADYRLLVDFGGGSVTLPALLDTGNRLCEPFSGKPVAVVRAGAVRGILEKAVTNADTAATGAPDAAGATDIGIAGMQGAPPPDASSPSDAPRSAPGPHIPGKVRYVPYASVGGEGVLPAVQPARMTLLSDRRKARDVTGAYIALCDQLGRGHYEAIIGTDFI